MIRQNFRGKTEEFLNAAKVSLPNVKINLLFT